VQSKVSAFSKPPQAGSLLDNGVLHYLFEPLNLEQPLSSFDPIKEGEAIYQTSTG
jgi:hypothetical protein